jgi:hypothetical protein
MKVLPFFTHPIVRDQHQNGCIACFATQKLKVSHQNINIAGNNQSITHFSILILGFSKV